MPRIKVIVMSNPINLILGAAFSFADNIRETDAEMGEAIPVPREALTGFLLMADFFRSNPKGVVANKDPAKNTGAPIVFSMDMVEMLAAYVSDMAEECDCPKCTARRAAEAGTPGQAETAASVKPH